MNYYLSPSLVKSRDGRKTDTFSHFHVSKKMEKEGRAKGEKSVTKMFITAFAVAPLGKKILVFATKLCFTRVYFVYNKELYHL